MLVLTRTKDQAIIVGDGIEITIVDIRGSKVRVGVTAAKEIKIVRKELLESANASDDAGKAEGPDQVPAAKAAR